MDPLPRSDVFDAYWRFAAERQAIFFRRFHGVTAPWTEDPILRTYKFCNVYRASDRVSQFLIRDVVYQPGFTPEDTLLRIILARLFSKIETWRLLEAAHGPIRASCFNPEAFAATLEAALQRQEAIYTNAFILCANGAYGHQRKHRNHLALVQAMLRDQLVESLARARNLESVYRLLIDYPLIGPFMAYQLAIDINYSELVNFDENDFTMPGPGAVRGIRKSFVSTGSMSMPDIIRWMVERQCQEFTRLGLPFQTLWGRPMHAIDCQSLFCEIDKYSRVAFPQLRSNRVRVKTTFSPTLVPLTPFYPPKWGINRAIEASLTTRMNLGVFDPRPVQLTLTRGDRP